MEPLFRCPPTGLYWKSNVIDRVPPVSKRCSKELLIHGITVGFFFLGENPMKSADKGCRQRGGDKDLRQRVARGLRKGSTVTLHASSFTLLPNTLTNAESSTIM